MSYPPCCVQCRYNCLCMSTGKYYFSNACMRRILTTYRFVCTLTLPCRQSKMGCNRMKDKSLGQDSLFHDGMLKAQDRFGDPQRAKRILGAMPSIEELDGEQIKFVEALPFFFIATSDLKGRLQCNFKGGGPGILVAQDSRTLCYPEYPGNDMMLSIGNMLVNPHIGILAISFDHRRRLKINGRARVEDGEHHPMRERWREARAIVCIDVEQVIRNCSRRIPRLAQASN